jgi:hypothetical protein
MSCYYPSKRAYLNKGELRYWREGKLEGKIPVNQGIRQGESLSPLMFNIVMNENNKKS